MLPAEKQRREQLISLIRETYAARGFQEIEAPALESLERLSTGQGGDNEKLVFKVLKRGEELDRAVTDGTELADLGLRFDLTVPLTRYFASNRGNLPRVLKAFRLGLSGGQSGLKRGAIASFCSATSTFWAKPANSRRLNSFRRLWPPWMQLD